MSSIIKVGKVQSSTGNDAITVADSGAITANGALSASGGIANAGTITAGTLGSSVVFPAGHIIAHSTPFYDNGIASSVETDQNSYQESGFEVSITPKLSSSSSRIVIQFYSGFVRQPGGSSAMVTWTIGRSTATSTSYASATDLNDDNSSYFYTNSQYVYWSQHSTFIDEGTYSAGTTYYYQIYFKSPNSSTTQLARQGGVVALLAYEVKI